MKIAKRITLFILTNLLIVTTLSVLLSALGVQPYLQNKGIDLQSLAVFCVVWGFGGAFISLGLSRIIAKWMMGVRVIDVNTSDTRDRALLQQVHQYAQAAGLTTMPEVGVYESPEVNAFATGPTRHRSLVAVSTGLLDRMDRNQTNGVLAHEVAHIANGDMVTMTLLQGIINAFVMFLARAIAWFASQFVDEEKRGMVQFGIMIALEIGLGILGMFVVAAFSRAREFRADAGSARLGGTNNMIAALNALKQIQNRADDSVIDDGRAPALAGFKISQKGSFMSLLSTHPSLDERIEKLRIA